MQRHFRLLREQAYAEGLAEFDALCEEPTFRDFVCMYIGEGYKRHRNVVSLGNSDPAVVALAHFWMKEYARNPLQYSIQYHADQRLDELTAFWSQRLDVPPTLIRPQRKSNSNGLAGRKWRSRHGVMTVRACDTLFRARLGAWMDRVKETWL